MLIDKNELICLYESTLEDYGYIRLNAIVYDIESKVDSFDVLTIKRFQRMLDDNYQFSLLGVNEEDVLEQINITLNEN